MQCTDPPLKIANAVDRLSRNFFWGSTESKKKPHLISWRKITKPKKEGGLGLFTAEPKNKALLAKLNWRFHKESNSLWAHVLAQKYTRRRNSTRGFRGRICSKTLSAVAKVNEVFKWGSKWVAGKNSSLSFWFDKWLDKAIVRSLVVGLLNRGEDELCIKDMVSPNGWN